MLSTQASPAPQRRLRTGKQNALNCAVIDEVDAAKREVKSPVRTGCDALILDGSGAAPLSSGCITPSTLSGFRPT